MRMARKLRNKGFGVSSDQRAPMGPWTGCSEYVSDLEDVNTWGYWIPEPLYLQWVRKYYLMGA